MKTLIIKLGATGDVVRTTTLLHKIEGEVHWLTSDMNTPLLEGVQHVTQLIPWSQRIQLHQQEYDQVINLEDHHEAAEILNNLKYSDLFGAYLNRSNQMRYTESSKEWFDLSLISRYGKKKADALKLQNRNTYQDMIFRGLGYTFKNHPYFLPKPSVSDLKGDIAIAPKSGAVWPMKNWAYFEELQRKLQQDGYIVNTLPMRDTLLEHFGDIQNHKLLISGDSLPMHIALGYGIPCVSLFICTSPWEIHGYGIQNKITSPYIDRFFYQRDFIQEAVESIPISDVYTSTLDMLA